MTGLPKTPIRPEHDGPHDKHPQDYHDEGPPFFRSWGRLYAAVLIFLTALIVIFYLFQETFT